MRKMLQKILALDCLVGIEKKMSDVAEKIRAIFADARINPYGWLKNLEHAEKEVLDAVAEVELKLEYQENDNDYKLGKLVELQGEKDKLELRLSEIRKLVFSAKKDLKEILASELMKSAEKLIPRVRDRWEGQLGVVLEIERLLDGGE